jgi:uncharacterized Zn-binding protein involved in type VI secretion
MPEAARGDGVDSVNTVHPAVGDLDSDDGVACDAAPTITATNVCSGNVFVNGIGAVREGDAVQSHTFPSCSTHAPPLVSFSGTVKINGKGAGRKGDTYGCGAIILTGSATVFIGG